MKTIPWLFCAAACLGALAAQKPWWEGEPLRIIDLTTSLTRIDAQDPAALAARKAGQQYNAEHLEIMGMPAGLDDRHFFFESKAAGRRNADFLKSYLPEARKRGIRVLIYFNVHWYTRQFAEQHADWRQIREDSRPLDGVYQTGADFCVNAPWREWVFQVLRDLAAYPIDGIFFDGPIFFADTCYCPYCRQKFRRAYGQDLPSKKERHGPEFARLLEFQAGSLRDFLRDSRRVLKAANPRIALYMNGGVRGGNWATARLNRVLIGEQDLLGSEGGFIYNDLTRIPLWKPGLTARLLETQAGGKPRIIFSAAAHKPWTFSLLPSPELRLLYADTIANAAGVWFGVTPSEFDQPEMEALAGMNRYLAANNAYYRDTRSEARAAIVWSDTTANFYQGADAQMIDVNRVAARGVIGNLDAEFDGIAEALVRARLPFDVIDDTTLERESLARYKVLFLPNVACMSDATATRLRDYVRDGGTLFATFETSLYDETGRRRPEFALAGLFGVADRRDIGGPSRWDFMKPQSADAVTAGIRREWIQAPPYHVRVRSAGATVLWQFAEPLAGPYDGVPALSSDPGLLVRRTGKGAAIYAPGDLGSAIQSFRIPELLDVVANSAEVSAARPFLLDNVPSSVEVVWRSQQEGRRRLLHLVNFTGEMTRPIRRIVPLNGARLTLLDSAPVKKAYTLVGKQPLTPVRDSEGRTSFALPVINEYEVVVIER